MGEAPAPKPVNCNWRPHTKRIGEKRPPGYKDGNKEAGRELGDALLWLQTIEYAAVNKKDVIIITDDAKDDWWQIVRDMQLGPRPELVTEFAERTHRRFFLYQPAKFMEDAKRFLNETPDPKAIEEAQSITHERKTNEEVRRLELERHLVSLQRALEKGGDDSEGSRQEFNRRRLGEAPQIEYARLHLPKIRRVARMLAAIPFKVWDSIDSDKELPPELSEEILSFVSNVRMGPQLIKDLRELADAARVGESDQLPRLETELVELLLRLRSLHPRAISSLGWIIKRY